MSQRLSKALSTLQGLQPPRRLQLLLHRTQQRSWSTQAASMAAAQAELTAPAPVLDREAFKETLHVKALRVPKKECHQLMQTFSGHTLDRPHVRSVVPDAPESPDTRLLLLDERYTSSELQGLPEKLSELVRSRGLAVLDRSVTLDYSHWPVDKVLKRLLPEGSEVPSSFECVGHIAHVNLRDELLPYKHLIGQVILDKNRAVKTVVNKVGTVANKYRTFQMEVLAGGAALETEVSQGGVRFRLNYGEVYWNSRLEFEHARLVQRFQPGQRVLDVMAGIGPFAIPAAQRGCTVYANDLNPRSVHWLKVNIRLNKVDRVVQPFEMDGRAFIRQFCGGSPFTSEKEPPHSSASPSPTAGAAPSLRHRDQQSSSSSSQPLPDPPFQHAILNLPASAISFLDAFRGTFSRGSWREATLPTVHVYCFAAAAETHADMRRRVEEALGGPLAGDPAIHLVRNVAPNKRMFCISFPVPPGVAFAPAEAAAAAASAARPEEETVAKRPRVE